MYNTVHMVAELVIGLGPFTYAVKSRRWALPAMVYMITIHTSAWPVYPIIFKKHWNGFGAGTQEVRSEYGTGRFDNLFLIPSVIPV